MRTGIMLALMTTSAMAQGLRDTDTELDATALKDALSGRIIEFFDGSKSYYDTDGGYIYTYVDGGEEWNGTYSLGPDGQVCVDFEVSGSRCDTFVLADDRLVLIIGDGTRFPVRSNEPMP